MLLYGPLHQPGFLWAERFKVLVPFIAINKDYFITMLRACQPLICSGLFWLILRQDPAFRGHWHAKAR